MTYPSDQIDELRHHCDRISLGEEGGTSYIQLEGLLLPEGCVPQKCDALLLPTEKDSYPSRLFLSVRPTSQVERNWNVSDARILERNWHAFSWKVTRGNLRLERLLVGHLKALV